MKTIYKYPISLRDSFSIFMPKYSQILCAQIQNGDPYLWALVETDYESEKRNFIVRGTGHNCTGLQFHHWVGTVQLACDGLVFHIFDAP